MYFPTSALSEESDELAHPPASPPEKTGLWIAKQRPAKSEQNIHADPSARCSHIPEGTDSHVAALYKRKPLISQRKKKKTTKKKREML